MGQYFTNDESLKSEYRYIKYNYDDYSFTFTSDLGVFSKDKIDYGSKILLENYLKSNNLKKDVLDVGCGYGFLGIVISKIMESYVELIDINKRAVHLTNINIKNNKVNANTYESNIYDNVFKKYDVIITNPPIRAGKSVYMKILNDSNYLKNDGELWFVINKDQGAKSVIKELSNIYEVNVLEKSKGFFVVFCKKH